MEITINYSYRIKFSSETEADAPQVKMPHSVCVSKALKLNNSNVDANCWVTAVNSIYLTENLLGVTESIASRILSNWIKNAEALKPAINSLTGDFLVSNLPTHSNEYPSMSLTKLVNEAQQIAVSYNQVLNTGHILLALVNSNLNIARTILILTGVPLDELESMAKEAIEQNDSDVIVEI